MGFFQLEKGSEVEGRIAMRMAASALLLAQSIILALSIIPLRADPSQHGSKDEAVAMVKRVEDIFNKEGAAATFKAVSDPSTKAFHDRATGSLNEVDHLADQIVSILILDIDEILA